MTRKRLFGTDGIRGRAGEGDLTEERVAALGAALGRVIRNETDRTEALLGHDGRGSATWIEQALTRGLHCSGVQARTAGLLPTPGLAAAAREGPFGLGLMISASHNPAEDNGIKVFNSEGAKLSDEFEDRVQDELEGHDWDIPGGPPPTPAPEWTQRYVERLLQAAGDLDLTDFDLVLDCANGAASRVGPAVFERLGASVHSIASAPDGTNINRHCGSTHLESLQAAVTNQGAQLGIALDGDGDRCLLVDEQGQPVDGDAILAVMARHLRQHGELAGDALVATVMSNCGLEKSLRGEKIGLVTVGVGDRRVVEGMREHGLELGGEQSGHIIFGARSHYTGDGLLTALRVLEAQREHGGTSSELFSCFRAFPQVLINLQVREKPALDSIEGLAESIERVENALGSDGRVLVRYSGTENLARVMVEGPDEEQIAMLAEDIAAVFRTQLAPSSV